METALPINHARSTGDEAAADAAGEQMLSLTNRDSVVNRAFTAQEDSSHSND
jgi:hypothetical protein